MKTFTLIAWAMAIGGWGCGATVGDPCTTASDCSNQVCINTEYAPGGYCSKACAVDGDDPCPTGSVCVRNGVGPGLSACFRTCDSADNCRGGYSCRLMEGSARAVCIGTRTP